MAGLFHQAGHIGDWSFRQSGKSQSYIQARLGGRAGRCNRQKGRDIPKDKAYDYVFGYTVCLDMTARELQRQHGQWFKGKSLDTFCPMGPWIVHKSALPDAQQARLICRVNGEVMQDGNTRDMIFDIPTIIESLSAGLTLEPGDIISTGTPSGVGFARVPPVFLKPGDKVEGEVEGIGILEVEIVAP